MSRPPHHEKIHNLVLIIVNADNTAVEWLAYNQIKEICDVHEGSKLDHPFQWETLGDFTYNNPEKTLNYYFKALKLANILNLNEYIVSVNLAIAEQYRELSYFKNASDFTESANIAAQSIQDIALQEEISEMLLSLIKYV